MIEIILWQLLVVISAGVVGFEFGKIYQEDDNND